jgi:hypothetical protein
MAPAEPRNPSAAPAHHTGRAAVLACFAFELLLVAALAGGAPAAPVAGLHVAAVAVTTVLVARSDGDFAVALMIGSATLALGPVGLLAAVAAAKYAEIGARDPTLAAWHERIIDRQPTDPAETLYRDIAEGRAYRALGVPATFADVMASDDVARRQRLLGFLAKRDEPVPEALLAAGLSASELAVRAPAAAVVARLRQREREARQ